MTTPTPAELREIALRLDLSARGRMQEAYPGLSYPDRQDELREDQRRLVVGILSHFPADGSTPITADWLREEFGFYDVDLDTMKHQNIGGSVVFDKGYWQWWYPHDCYVVFKDRHHASSLFVALGIEPKRKESHETDPDTR